jgi:hypothetical protein
MSGCSKLIASACVAASAAWFAGPAAAAPAHPAGLQNHAAESGVIQVRDGGGRGGARVGRGGGSGVRFGNNSAGRNWSGSPGRNWSGRNWSGRGGNWSGRRWAGRRYWGGGPGIAFGLGIGAPYAYGYGYPYDDWYGSYGYGDDYVVVAPGGRDDDAVAYCSRRFRSYDPDTGTYLGYDGQRHPCP